MKRTPLRRQSAKARARDREAKPIRDQLREEVDHCEVCGHDPRRVNTGFVRRVMDVHEIARGSQRWKALDKRFALLVVCRVPCHDDLDDTMEWPEARQLAKLLVSRPDDYNLKAYMELFHPNAPHFITQADVDKWLSKD